MARIYDLGEPRYVMTRPSTPVLVGAGQYTQRWSDDGEHLDALGLMASACRLAIDDSCARNLAPAIDTVAVVNTITWSYSNAPAQLSERLGLRPQRLLYTSVGGNTPQYLVNRFARELERSREGVVLLCGAEAGYSARKIGSGIDLAWPPIAEPEHIDGDQRLGSSDLELSYDLVLPAFIYPFFETAVRAELGRSPAEHALALGRLYSRLSRIAAANPHAWSRQELTPEQISTVTPDNRIIGYPYTKRMNANMSVDQGAAVILTTAGCAQKLGIDESRWVYPMGGAHLNDVWEFSRRPRLDRSPAIAAASKRALQQAGVALDEISYFDLYSCFPSVVQIGSRMIGIPDGDPRDLSITGGLAYFGGPGNNYSMHAIATAAERLRTANEELAMVTALGWYATKHAIGVYGRRPGAEPWAERDDADEQARIDASALPEPIAVADGDLRVEAFTVRHRRDGTPRVGIVLGRLADDARALAQIEAAPAELEALERTELVGRTGRCRHDVSSALNLVRFA